MEKTLLEQWLGRLEQGCDGGVIDLGLERVSQVRAAMNLCPTVPIITVAGTNGKGSVCAYLTAIYRAAGYRVGTLTSPHLLRFNERIAINGEAVSDDCIVDSFERIEKARGDIPLTYFEFNTLAAVDIFVRENADVLILEVGLGGRLDAVNIFDASVAVVVSVDLDHQHFLGNTVEVIAREKAGIFRPNTPAICGQNPPPQSLVDYATQIGANLYVSGRDFSLSVLDEKQWSFLAQRLPVARNLHALPHPVLRGHFQIHNASVALAALESLQDRLPVDRGAIRKGLLLAENLGRFQVLPGRPLRVLDVGHNPHAAGALKKTLAQLPFAKQKIAVFSMLVDKDMESVVRILRDDFDQWWIAPLPQTRGRSAENMAQVFEQMGVSSVRLFESIGDAWCEAVRISSENDRIVGFGSFHTVAEIMQSQKASCRN